MEPSPQPLNLAKTFGYGDRLGLAGAGHLAANRHGSFLPILAQQSIREMTRTNRTPEEVMDAAKAAIAETGYTGVWGADADHLKTEADVELTSSAGFCFFTIDPSEFVNNTADNMGETDLLAIAETLSEEGALPVDWENLYVGKTYETDGGPDLSITREEALRAIAKYGRAIAYCETMAAHIAATNGNRAFEIEVSVDETDSPTSAQEHLFFALELKRRGVQIVSLAPRFIGEFEKGIDYKGDLEQFETSLVTHTAIARSYGPYKISIHSGSDKFSIYPTIGRVCGDLLHVKTAGTSYLEALRVVCHQAPSLFGQIIDYSMERFSQDKLSYHISATEDDFRSTRAQTPQEMEQTYLDENAGRQLLHVTFGSVLTKGHLESGQSFKSAILEVLEQEKDLHHEFLEAHLGKHVQLLEQG